YGLFTTYVSNERFENDVAIRTRQRFVFRVSVLCASVCFGIAQHLPNLIDLTLVRLQCFAEVCWLLLKSAKAAASTRDAWKIDDERDLRNDRHLFRRGTEQVDECCLTGNQTARRSSQCVGDTFNASHGNVRAVRVDGDDRLCVWV